MGFQLSGSLATGHLSGGDEVADADDEGFEGCGAGAVEGDSAFGQQFVEAGADGALKEREFVGVVVVEGGAVYGGFFGYVLHGNGVELLLFHEFDESLLEKLAGSQDAGIHRFLWHQLGDFGQR